MLDSGAAFTVANKKRLLRAGGGFHNEAVLIDLGPNANLPGWYAVDDGSFDDSASMGPYQLVGYGYTGNFNDVPWG